MNRRSGLIGAAVGSLVLGLWALAYYRPFPLPEHHHFDEGTWGATSKTRRYGMALDFIGRYTGKPLSHSDVLELLGAPDHQERILLYSPNSKFAASAEFTSIQGYLLLRGLWVRIKDGLVFGAGISEDSAGQFDLTAVFSGRTISISKCIQDRELVGMSEEEASNALRPLTRQLDLHALYYIVDRLFIDKTVLVVLLSGDPLIVYSIGLDEW